ncbi:hypothetical protein JHK86_023651 [Glycine max]|nr:hypothetical protein JHK86_023651 [Glycine max]
MDSRKSNEKTKSSTTSTVELPPPISASEALMVNALCVLLGLRLLDCEHCLLHRTRYSSFSHTLLHLGTLNSISFRFRLFLVHFSFSHSAVSFRLQSSPL